MLSLCHINTQIHNENNTQSFNIGFNETAITFVKTLFIMKVHHQLCSYNNIIYNDVFMF